jgi:polyadenylate-binding protein
MATALPQVMVQGLPATANEDFLENFFSEVRPVHHPGGVVIKQKVDRRGRAITYAFVTFDSRQDVEQVIAELNYTKLDGAPIRIVHADTETRNIVRSGKGNLFVKNLDPTIEDSQLHDAFANFGEIVSCQIATDEKRESRGYGYVQFKREEDAHQAMSDLKDASINGRPLTIQPFRRRQRLPEDEVFTNVYIKNLPPSITTEEALVDLFGPFGDITSVKLESRDGPNGDRFFFGFCNFKTHSDAVRAIQELNGREEDGRVLDCVRFKTREERLRELQRKSEQWKQATYERFKGRNLYVRGFDENFSDEDLAQLFRRFGELESVRIQRDDTRASRRFGFVCFKSVEDAQRCIADSALVKFQENGKQVYVAEMIPANRKRQLNIQSKNVQARGHAADQRVPLPGAPGVPAAPFLAAPREAAPFAVAQVSFPAPVPLPAFPAVFGSGPAGGEAHLALFPSAPPKERVRQEIFDQASGNPQHLTTLLNRLKELSDDQALQLTKNQGLLVQWMQQE